VRSCGVECLRVVRGRGVKKRGSDLPSPTETKHESDTRSFLTGGCIKTIPFVHVHNSSFATS